MRLIAASGPEREPLTSPRLWLKCASFRSLLGPEAVGCHPCQVIFGGLSGPVFEGPPVPLISRGTPLRERAPSGPRALSCYTAVFCSCTPALRTVWSSEEPHQSHLSHTSTADLIKRSFWAFPLRCPSNIQLRLGKKKRESSSLRLNVKTQVLQHSSPNPWFLLYFHLYPPLAPFDYGHSCMNVFLCGQMHFVSSCGTFARLNTHVPSGMRKG